MTILRSTSTRAGVALLLSAVVWSSIVHLRPQPAGVLSTNQTRKKVLANHSAIEAADTEMVRTDNKSIGSDANNSDSTSSTILIMERDFSFPTRSTDGTIDPEATHRPAKEPTQGPTKTLTAAQNAAGITTRTDNQTGPGAAKSAPNNITAHTPKTISNYSNVRGKTAQAAAVITAAIPTKDKAPSWYHLSHSESLDYLQKDGSSCNHPYRHCCLGQCRQETYRIGKRDALWKWRGPGRQLANLTNVLDYMESTFQPEHNVSSCNIVFAGDSLSSDHAMAATCQLLTSGYTLKSCNSGFGGRLFGNDTAVTCESNIHPSLRHTMLENGMAKSCPNVTIVFLELSAPTMAQFKQAQPLLESGGIFVFNWGVHCNNGDEECIHAMLSSMILPLVKRGRTAPYNRWEFLYREHEPQHFKTPGGVFQHGVKPGCGPIVGKADNWRNRAARKWLSRHNLTSRVPTIPLFRALLPLWQLHHPKDCTHYCYDPMRFDLTWDGMLNALTSPKGQADQ